MLLWLAAALAATAAALLVYGGRGAHAGRSPWVPALLRAGAILLLVALLLDAPIGRAAPLAPFAALDVSASWRRGGDTLAWRTAVAHIRSAGADSVFLVGDSLRLGPPPERPADRASQLRPVVDRALAAGRPLVLVTDGEAADPDVLAALPARSRVEVVERREGPDVALLSLDAPRAAVSGDTLDVRVTLTAGGRGAAAGTITLLLGDRTLLTAPFDSLEPYGERSVPLQARFQGADGPTTVRAIVASAGDGEPRNDTITVPLELSRAAGAVFVSTAPDFDARYALAVLRGALALPARGYYRVAPGRWRSDGSLAPVTEAEVRQAFRDAPIAVLHGDTNVFGPPRAATRGALALIAPPAESEGDWYPVAAPPSPLAPALTGLPWDSLPPIDVSGDLRDAEWTGLLASRGRGQERRTAVTGTDRPRRIVVVGASGFWRWRFRGGASADAFAAVWGSIFDWLAAGRPDVRAAVPSEALVRAGEPIRWRRGTTGDSTIAVTIAPVGAPGRGDSLVLRFADGASVAETAPLGPGVYEVRARGGVSLLAVNASQEWLPRAPVLRSGSVGGAAARSAAQGLQRAGWAYALVLAFLALEWLVRRRAGLR